MNSAFHPSLADETHISSLIVQVKPASVPEVARRIGMMAGADVPIVSPEGKLIACLETGTLGEVTDSIDVIASLAGVLSCTLVSHHVESTAGLDDIVDAPAHEPKEATP